MAFTAEVHYEFNELDLVVDITVQSTVHNYMDTDNVEGLGYAIVGGTVTYTDPTAGKRSVPIASQEVNSFNVLWANAGLGNGGSQDGIDTSGISITGDNGYLAWSRKPNAFWFQEGTANKQVTLKSVNNWPPAQ